LALLVRFIDAFVDDLDLNEAGFARVGVWDRRERRFSRIYLRRAVMMKLERGGMARLVGGLDCLPSSRL